MKGTVENEFHKTSSVFHVDTSQRKRLGDIVLTPSQSKRFTAISHLNKPECVCRNDVTIKDELGNMWGWLKKDDGIIIVTRR